MRKQTNTTKVVAKAARKAPVKRSAPTKRRALSAPNAAAMAAKLRRTKATDRQAAAAASRAEVAKIKAEVKAKASVGKSAGAQALHKVVDKAIKAGSPVIVEQPLPVCKHCGKSYAKPCATAALASKCPNYAAAKGKYPAITVAPVSLPKHDPRGTLPDNSGPFEKRSEADAFLREKGWDRDYKSVEMRGVGNVFVRRTVTPIVAALPVRPKFEGMTVADIYREMRRTRITILLDDQGDLERIAALDVELRSVGESFRKLWDEGVNFVHRYVVDHTVILVLETLAEGETSNLVCLWQIEPNKPGVANLGELNFPGVTDQFEAEEAFAKDILGYEIERREAAKAPKKNGR